MLLTLLVALIIAVGLVGTVVPGLPGTVLILAGIVVHAVGSGFDPIGPWRLAAFVLLAGLAVGLDYAAGALGVKRLGGSGWAAAGALAGALVGLFFGPAGLLLGPVAGAVLVEWLYCRRFDVSLRSGLGTVAGMLVGAVAKFGLALVMISLFVYFLWRG